MHHNILVLRVKVVEIGTRLPKLAQKNKNRHPFLDHPVLDYVSPNENRTTSCNKAPVRSILDVEAVGADCFNGGA